MQLTVNGDAVQLPDEATLSDLLNRLGLAQARVAVELNREIIPRSQHDGHILQNGDVLEIVQAIGGG